MVSLTFTVPESRRSQPLVFEPPRPALEDIATRFDTALLAARQQNPVVVPKVPNYGAWLSNLWDAYQESKRTGSLFRFYPTFGQDRPSVADAYPDSHRPWIEPAQPGLPGVISPPPNTHYPLEDEIDRVLTTGSIIGLNNSRPISSSIFVGQGYNPEAVNVKLYCCLKTNRALEFSRRLVEWAKRTSRLNFEGKFYELMYFGSHNKLCLYAPFEHTPAVAGFLADSRDYFHPVEFNHPAGIQLFPGVSAVIISGTGHFDERVSSVLENVRLDSKQAFMQSAREILERHPNLKYHFAYLKARETQYFPPLRPS